MHGFVDCGHREGGFRHDGSSCGYGVGGWEHDGGDCGGGSCGRGEGSYGVVVNVVGMVGGCGHHVWHGGQIGMHCGRVMVGVLGMGSVGIMVLKGMVVVDVLGVVCKVGMVGVVSVVVMMCVKGMVGVSGVVEVDGVVVQCALKLFGSGGHHYSKVLVVVVVVAVVVAVALGLGMTHMSCLLCLEYSWSLEATYTGLPPLHRIALESWVYSIVDLDPDPTPILRTFGIIINMYVNYNSS